MNIASLWPSKFHPCSASVSLPRRSELKETQEFNRPPLSSIDEPDDIENCFSPQLNIRRTIFNVSSVLGNDNRMSYKPQLISIGPYHHGLDNLRGMEEHKQRYFRNLLQRVGLVEAELLNKVRNMEDGIRKCYWSQFTNMSSDEFMKMIVVDGCFVIEFFRIRARLVPLHGDPLICNIPIQAVLFRDLMLFENQLPFQLLECLYKETLAGVFGDSITFAGLILNECNWTEMFRDQMVSESNATHLLDLIRMSLIPNSCNGKRFLCSIQLKRSREVTVGIPSVRNLRLTGIHIRLKVRSESPIAVEFKRGKLLIPKLELDDFTLPLFRNIMCVEQCNAVEDGDDHMTTFLIFLGALIRTEEDMDYLCKKGIIINNFDTNSKVVSLIHQILAGIGNHPDDCYLKAMFVQVNEYCAKSRHTQFATFKDTYFRTPWTFISAVAAFIILTLTAISTVFTVLSYYSMDK